MLASVNCAAAPTWAISGTGAALLSADYSGLNDGRPGTVTRLQGCTSSANPTILTGTGFSLPVTTGSPYYLIVGILNTDLAVGSTTQVQVNGGWSGAGLLTQATSQFPKAIAPSPAQQPYVNAWYVFTPSQISSSVAVTSLTVKLTTASTSQVFSVGEIVIGLAVDLPISNLDVQWVDPSKLNRSSGNQPYPVLRKPFRATSANVSAQTFAQTFGSTTTVAPLQDVLYAMAVAPKLAIVPTWRQAGGATVDTDMLQRMAQMARGTNFGALKSSGSEKYYTVPLAFEELL